MRRCAILSLVLSSSLAAGAVFAQQQPAPVMAADPAGNVGGDLAEPSGEPDTILSIDVTGVESWGTLNNPDNTVLLECVGEGAQVTGIGWNVTLTTFGTSRLSDVATYFDGQDQDLIGAFLTFGPGGSGTMNFDSGGIIDLTDMGIPNIPIGDDHMLYIQFYEGIDDIPDAADAIYIDDPMIAGDSTYEIAVLDFHYICGDNILAIPTLDTVGVIVLILVLAASGTFFLRRRSSAARL